MNAKRNLIHICLAARLLTLLLLLMLPAAAQAQFTYTTIFGGLTITGYTGPSGAVVIPASINGYPVTSIGDYAFQYWPMTSVTIPNSVTSIGNYAFYECGNLTRVYFQGYPPSAGLNVFDGDNNAIAYYFLGIAGWGSSFDGLPAVGISQFNYTTNNGTITITGYNGSGGAVTIPSTINSFPVTSIRFAFFQSTSLTSIVIPNSVTNIGSDTFYHCTSLSSVTIGTNVTSIGSQAFYQCTSLTSVPMRNSLTSIGSEAFYQCTSLTSITMPNNLITIGDAAFEYCQGLTSVMIPNSVISVGSQAFSACSGLTGVYFQSNALTAIGSNVFEYDNKAVIYYLQGTTGWGATFAGLPTVIVGLSYMTNNGTITITGCTATGPGGAITIPVWDNGLRVTSIGTNAFFFNTNLTSITIPNSVINIESQAFNLCTKLIRVTIGTNVTSIGTFAFNHCFSLTGIFFQGNAPSVGSYAFNGDNSATAYYMPGTSGWNNFSTIAGIPALLWNPQAQTSGASFGVRTNRFGFNITGTANIPIVVDASTSLASSVWTSLQACTITNGSIYFSDPQWTNYPSRFYRIRSP